MSTTPTAADLIRELNGTACRCGYQKKPRWSLCNDCYKTLPQSLRGALWRRIGEGYEEAYTEAALYLDANGRPAKAAAAPAAPAEPAAAPPPASEIGLPGTANEINVDMPPAPEKPAEATSKSEPESTVPPTTPPKE
ncbi:MAG: hypothetical protein ACTHK7_18385 [Aureliella sp.]